MDSRLESQDQHEVVNNVINKELQNCPNTTEYKVTTPEIKDHLSNAMIDGLLSPSLSCSESNVSDVTSIVPRIPSTSSSRRHSSAFSDYEDYEGYLAYEDIGNGVICRIEITEDSKESNLNVEESYPLLRSSSFTEDR